MSTAFIFLLIEALYRGTLSQIHKKRTITNHCHNVEGVDVCWHDVCHLLCVQLGNRSSVLPITA